VVLERIIGFETFLAVPVPFCAECRRAGRKAAWRGVLWGLLVGALIVVGGSILVGLLLGRRGEDPWIAILGLAFVAAPVVGWLLARTPDPVRLRRFSSRRGTVQIRFANAEYAALFEVDQELRMASAKQ